MSRRLLIASLLIAVVIALGIFFTQKRTIESEMTSTRSVPTQDVVEEEGTVPPRSVAEAEAVSQQNSNARPTTPKETAAEVYERSYPTKMAKTKSVANVPQQRLKNISALQNTPWKILQGAWAVPEGTVSSQEVMGHVAHFDIVNESNLSEQVVESSARAVVFDPALGNTGVISGNIILECAEISKCGSIQFSDEIEVITRLEGMGLIYIRPHSQQYDFQKYYALFKEDANFKSVRLEILGNSYGKF